MKYVLIILFNLFAFYVLGIFVFGEGGVRNISEKTSAINELEMEKIEEQTELTELMNRLLYLQELEQPDLNIMAQNGVKYEESVIFKFDTVESASLSEGISFTEFPEMNDYKIYLIIGLVVIMMIAGNSILLIKMARTA